MPPQRKAAKEAEAASKDVFAKQEAARNERAIVKAFRESIGQSPANCNVPGSVPPSGGPKLIATYSKPNLMIYIKNKKNAAPSNLQAQPQIPIDESKDGQAPYRMSISQRCTKDRASQPLVSPYFTGQHGARPPSMSPVGRRAALHTPAAQQGGIITSPDTPSKVPIRSFQRRGSAQRQTPVVRIRPPELYYSYPNAGLGSGQSPPGFSTKRKRTMYQEDHRLVINDEIKLMNQYGKWDDSSASTQASPDDIYQSYDRRPRPKARQAPTSLLAYKENLSRSSTLLPLGAGGKWCLPGQIIVDDQDETDVMMQDVMDSVTPDLSREAMAPQPDSVYQAASPFTNPSKNDLIMSPASRRPREHFRGCISPISVTEASEHDQHQGCETEADRISAMPNMHKCGSLTPPQEVDLPSTYDQQCSLPKHPLERRFTHQFDGDKVAQPVYSDSPNRSSLTTRPRESLPSAADQMPSSLSASEHTKKDSEQTLPSQDTSGDTTSTQPPPSELGALLETGAQCLLAQRHVDRLLSSDDQIDDSTRRDGVAAAIMARLTDSFSKASPPTHHTEQRQAKPPGFKGLALSRIKQVKAEDCSFCNFEGDFGLCEKEFLLPLEAFGFYCDECANSQKHFFVQYAPTDRLNELDEGKERQLNNQWRVIPLRQTLNQMGGRKVAEQHWRAQVLPQNTKSVIDGRDIDRFRGILTCRGSDHGQIDVERVQICHKCSREKFEIISHWKHLKFELISEEPYGSIHRRRCMICSQRGAQKCAECPLRLCDDCEVILRRECKGYLDNLFYGMNRTHIRNDAFLLRSDGGGL